MVRFCVLFNTADIGLYRLSSCAVAVVAVAAAVAIAVCAFWTHLFLYGAQVFSESYTKTDFSVAHGKGVSHANK